MPWLIPWIVQSVACLQLAGLAAQFAGHGGSISAFTLSIRPNAASPRARTANDESGRRERRLPRPRVLSAAACASRTSW